jgi:enterochelin esterase-like enzyme
MIPRAIAMAGLTALFVLLATVGFTSGQPLVAGVASGSLADIQVPGSTSQGTLIETSFASAALGIAPPLRIYLPPGYSSSTERYPVLYLLHGNATDSDYTEWTAHMKIDFTAGSMISTGQIAPMIIVMPYGQHSFFMNITGGLRWADYITQDLVRYVDANYRTTADREHRAVGGNSMGATGALHLSFNHPDLFSIVGAHSPVLRTGPDAVISDWSNYSAYDPLRLAETAPNLKTLQIWVDIGDQDPWRGNAGGLHDRLTARGISHTWNIFPGPHDTPYWVAHSPDYLRFYSNSFQRNIPAPTPTAIPVALPTAVAAPSATATPGPAPAPQPRAEFMLGFAALASQIPGVVGVPLESEHWGANGDSLQQTSTGLMAWRKADNWTAFTDGSQTWINGPYGVQMRANDALFPWETASAGQ